MRTTIFKITLAALVISGLSACGTSTAPSAAGHDTPASIDNEAAECILKSPHLQVGTTPDLVLNGVTYTNSHQPDAKSAIEMPIADPGPPPAGSCDGNTEFSFGSGLYDPTGPIGGNPTGHGDLFGMVVPPPVPIDRKSAG